MIFLKFSQQKTHQTAIQCPTRHLNYVFQCSRTFQFPLSCFWIYSSFTWST